MRCIKNVFKISGAKRFGKKRLGHFVSGSI